MMNNKKKISDKPIKPNLNFVIHAVPNAIPSKVDKLNIFLPLNLKKFVI